MTTTTTTTNEEYLFIVACYAGSINEAINIFQQNPDMNISASTDTAFCYACMNGHLDIAQWLLQVVKETGRPDINISALNNWAFRYACYYDHLEVCKLLYSLDVDVEYDNHWAFRYSIANNQLRICKWLQSMKPYLYVIHYKEDGTYKGYTIRKKEEALWEQRKYPVWLASDQSPNKDSLFYKIPQDVSRHIIQSYL